MGGNGDEALVEEVADDIADDVDVDSSDNPFFVPSEGDGGDEADSEDGDTVIADNAAPSKEIPVEVKEVEFVTDAAALDGLSFKLGDDVEELLEVKGGSGEGFTWSSQGLPYGLEIVPLNPPKASRVLLSGSPSTAEALGEHHVTLRADDVGGDNGSASISFKLAVDTEPIEFKVLEDPCSQPLNVEIVKDNLWDGGARESDPVYELGRTYDVKVKVTGGKPPYRWHTNFIVYDSLHEKTEDGGHNYYGDGEKDWTRCVGCGSVRERQQISNGEIVTFTMNPIFDGPLPVDRGKYMNEDGMQDLEKDPRLRMRFQVTDSCPVGTQVDGHWTGQYRKLDQDARIRYPNHSLSDLSLEFAYRNYNSYGRGDRKIQIQLTNSDSLELWDDLAESGSDELSGGAYGDQDFLDEQSIGKVVWDDISEWSKCDISMPLWYNCVSTTYIESKQVTKLDFNGDGSQVLDIDTVWLKIGAGYKNSDDGPVWGDMDLRTIKISSKYWWASYNDNNSTNGDRWNQNVSFMKMLAVNFPDASVKAGAKHIFTRRPYAGYDPDWIPDRQN